MSEKHKEGDLSVDSIDDGKKDGGKTSTGLEENIAGLLCYVATFVTGIIFLFLEKDSKFVRFHAMQSTVLFLGIWVFGFAVDFIPFIGWMLSSLISLIGLILWIVLMVKAYQKEYYQLPIVGDMAEDFLQKLDSKTKA